MTRVLFTHRYSMAEIRGACASGAYPRQHLWGADALERAGLAVEYGFFGAQRRAAAALSWRLGGRLGDLDEEAALWRRARADDGGGGGAVVYAGEATQVRGLAGLRRAGWRVPVVGVVHSRPAAWMTRLDVAVCLSSRVRAHLVDVHGRDPATTPLAPWGPDLGFAGYTATGDELIVSAGQTERDQPTLLAALHGTGLRARVYAGADAALAEPAGVELVRVRRGDPLHHGTVLQDLRRASVVAIPLRETDRLAGLSEVADALALAKPIVMTRSPAVDFDPERAGCGIAVAPGDVAGWRAALERLAGDPELRARLGRAGREFAEREHNAALFGERVVAAVRSVA
jgi:glycosyltransferase involved in cell wall biosynthesis